MPKKPLLALTTLCLLTSVLVACGQKGPLYLPQEPAAPARPAATATQPGAAAASAEEHEEEESDEPQAQPAGEDSMEPEVEK